MYLADILTDNSKHNQLNSIQSNSIQSNSIQSNSIQSIEIIGSRQSVLRNVP